MHYFCDLLSISWEFTVFSQMSIHQQIPDSWQSEQIPNFLLLWVK